MRLKRETPALRARTRPEKAAERGIHHAKRIRQNQKLKPYRKAKLMEQRADKANVKYLYQKTLQENLADGLRPQLTSNPLSRWPQKRAIKQSYAAAKAGRGAATAKNTAEKTTAFVARHSKGLAVIVALILFFVFVFSSFSSCSVMISGGFNSVIATSYTGG